MSAEEIIDVTQDAVTEYIKTKATPQSIRREVFQILDKQRRHAILAMLGMKIGRYGSDSFEVDRQSTAQSEET